MKIDTLACTLALAAALPVAASAATLDFFLKIDAIPGDSMDSKHKGEIDVTSWSWGVSNSLGSGGGGGGGVAATPVFQPFAWTQPVDRSIPVIFTHLATGARERQARLSVVRPDGMGTTAFFELVFDNIGFTNLQLQGSAAGQTASAALRPLDKVTLRFRPQTSSGSYGSWIEGSFDLRGARPAFSGDPAALLGLAEAGASPLPVPEPQTWSLLAAGLLLGAAWQRRRRGCTPGPAPGGA